MALLLKCDRAGGKVGDGAMLNAGVGRGPASAMGARALSSRISGAIPPIAAVYLAFTLDSAYQYVRGRGGVWKGRAQANVSQQ